jgi:hypothetical protein
VAAFTNNHSTAEAKNEKFRSSEGLEATEEEMADAFADEIDDDGLMQE